MSFKNLDIDNALSRIADRKIEQAMREGKFDNLPGAGRPLNLAPLPTDERARMAYWVAKLLKQGDESEVKMLGLRKQATPAPGRLSGACSQTRHVPIQLRHVARDRMSGVGHCSNAVCMSRNPASARYCRRCGSPMHAAPAV
jgi:NADH pyrophosphatase NudC (nudix superfamily)